MINQINSVILTGVVTSEPRFIRLLEDGFVFNLGVTRNGRLNQLPIFIPTCFGKNLIKLGTKLSVEGCVLNLESERHVIYAINIKRAKEKASEENITMLEGNVSQIKSTFINGGYVVNANITNVVNNFSPINNIPLKTSYKSAYEELMRTKECEEITAIGEMGVMVKKDDGSILRITPKKITR